MKFVLSVFILIIISCASNKKDFRPQVAPNDKARIIIYRPHQFESMFAEYDIYIGNRPIKRLEDSGYIITDVAPGEIVLNSHHYQTNEYPIQIKVDVKEGEIYYFRLDTMKKKLSALDYVTGILDVYTVVSGVKSEMRLKAGVGDFKDLKNMVSGQSAQQSMQSKSDDKRDEFGFHAIYRMDESIALKDLRICCSSKDAGDLLERQMQFESARFLNQTPLGYHKKINISKLNKKYKRFIDSKNPYVLKYEAWLNKKNQLLERALWRHTKYIYELEVHHGKKKELKMISQSGGFLPRDSFSKHDHSIVGSLIRLHDFLPLTDRGSKYSFKYLKPLNNHKKKSFCELPTSEKNYLKSVNCSLDDITMIFTHDSMDEQEYLIQI
ncbi:MAG: DUF2846 domain-containing protein [Bdellovibrionota bacterium]|nr:DUF2846 domain-containing protein [Bdellovibrionota bacterium]